MISAIGTTVATFVALFLLRQGQQDRRAMREDKRMNQASRVTCWCEWNPESPDIDYDRPHVPAIFVRNTSEEAVYQVFVDYHHPERGLERIDVGPVPPGETRHRDVVAVIPDDPRWEPSSLLPALFFSDASGYPWKRTVKGRLVPDPGAHHDGFTQEGGQLNLGQPRPMRRQNLDE